MRGVDAAAVQRRSPVGVDDVGLALQIRVARAVGLRGAGRAAFVDAGNDFAVRPGGQKLVSDTAVPFGTMAVLMFEPWIAVLLTQCK